MVRPRRVEPMVRMNITVDEETYEGLRELAELTGVRSMSAVVRMAVRRLLDVYRAKGPEGVREMAEGAR